jgi:iron complex transport system substrate-binding protein
VPEHPQRLVSLAPSITETLFALGLGDRLVGDTDYCDYPPEAKTKARVGPVLNPSLERIVALKPDLVLGSPEANRIETAQSVERLGIPIYGVTARTVEETLRSIADLGRILGRQDAAEQLVGQLRQRIAAVENRIAGRARPRVLFVVWHRPLTTVGPRTFVADVLRCAGGISVSDDLRGDWPRLTLEEALRRNPDAILLAQSESIAPKPEEFRQLPGWREFRAVREGRMYVISDAVIRASPRLVDAIEEVARALHPLDSNAGRGAAP